MSHTYQTFGDYTARLSVTDASGQTAQASVLIQVTPPIPPPPPGKGTVGGRIRVTVAKRPGRFTLGSAATPQGEPAESTRADTLFGEQSQRVHHDHQSWPRSPDP